jgi:hypothetical protein
MLHRFLSRWTKERGQVLVITALLAVVLIGFMGLAIDIGRVWVAKARLSRSVDAAALAGALELPDLTSDGDGDGDTAQSKVLEYLNANEPDAYLAGPPTSPGAREVRVDASLDVESIFLRVIPGIPDSITISSQAAAGFGEVPLDSVLAIDATGSMGDPPCNSSQSNSGCPIKEAKDAARNFVGILLGNTGPGNDTQVGVNSFRGCYNPPRLNSNCVPATSILDLSSNWPALQAGIGNLSAVGGSGTNVCLGLMKAGQVLLGTGSNPNPDALRFIVILTDGDNNYNGSAAFGQGEPPDQCRPNTSPSGSDSSPACGSAQTRERQLDVKTQQMADLLKAQGAEIFVVGFGVCGSANNNTCNTSMIGGTAGDTTADRNLLKCIATQGTANSHYFEVPSATDLPDVFGQIARQIAFRLIE